MFTTGTSGSTTQPRSASHARHRGRRQAITAIAATLHTIAAPTTIRSGPSSKRASGPTSPTCIDGCNGQSTRPAYNAMLASTRGTPPNVTAAVDGGTSATHASATTAKNAVGTAS